MIHRCRVHLPREPSTTINRPKPERFRHLPGPWIDTYLDRLDVEADAERRRGYLEKAGGEVVNLVAVGAPPRPSRHWGRHGEVVGWACHGPYREGEVRTGDAELYTIYVRRDHLSTGVGRALLQESAHRCAAAGHERMLLWVLKENARARRFYEHHCFAPDGAEEPFEVDGVPVPEMRYVRALGNATPS